MHKTLALSIVVLSLAGCFPAFNPNTAPGLGESTAAPTGTPYNLPAGISVEGGKILAGDADLCATPEVELGGGQWVSACLPLVNATASENTVTLPPGLIFVSKSLETQNGLLVQPQVIVIPGSTRRLVKVYLYCVNAMRHASDSTDEFTLGPVSDNAGLKEIIDLLAGKTIHSDDGDVSKVQDAVWDVTDILGKITDEDRANLQAM